MPCDRTCSCLDCPELHAEILKRGRAGETGIFWCPIAMQQREEDVAVST
ncbi:MAG: hypothetical protein A4E49_03164 [Methanosaeta sp. PtaU1.Bin112]|nr:MAG: hypothetical protein A4E49_03164 [Methanosaeta sp. PtaU1.Bin112]